MALRFWSNTKLELSGSTADDADVLAEIPYPVSYWISHSVSESTVCRTIQKVEKALMTSKEFHLPGKKKLQPSETFIEVALIDALSK